MKIYFMLFIFAINILAMKEDKKDINLELKGLSIEEQVFMVIDIYKFDKDLLLKIEEITFESIYNHIYDNLENYDIDMSTFFYDTLVKIRISNLLKSIEKENDYTKEHKDLLEKNYYLLNIMYITDESSDGIKYSVIGYIWKKLAEQKFHKKNSLPFKKLILDMLLYADPFAFHYSYSNNTKKLDLFSLFVNFDIGIAPKELVEKIELNFNHYLEIRSSLVILGSFDLYHQNEETLENIDIENLGKKERRKLKKRKTRFEELRKLLKENKLLSDEGIFTFIPERNSTDINEIPKVNYGYMNTGHVRDKRRPSIIEPEPENPQIIIKDKNKHKSQKKIIRKSSKTIIKKKPRKTKSDKIIKLLLDDNKDNV